MGWASGGWDAPTPPNFGTANLVAGSITIGGSTPTAASGSIVAGPDYGIDPTASSVTVLGTTYSMGADKTGATDSGTALNNAVLAAFFAKSYVRLLGNANFMTNSPIQLYRLADTVGAPAPSILGEGSGDDNFAGHHASTKLTAGSSFPIGEFMIDYLGTNVNTFAPLSGFTIAHFLINGNSRAAGIRLTNNMDSTLSDLVINSTAIPSPANATGTPTGAVSLVKSGGNDYSYNNLLDRVFVSMAGKDCFHLDQTTSSSINARQCAGITGGRYSFVAGDNVVLIDCDAQNSTTGSYYIYGASLLGCHEDTFPSKGNSIILDNPFATTGRMSQIIGGYYVGTNQAALSEANASLVHYKWAEILAQFVGVNFRAGSTTSDWLYVDAGAVTRSKVSFNACNFNPVSAPATQKFNFNGNYNTKFVNCPGINPIGLSNLVPGASPWTYTNQDGVDEDIYLQGGTVTTLVKGGQTLDSVGGAAIHNRVSLAPNESFTLTYTVAPTGTKDQR